MSTHPVRQPSLPVVLVVVLLAALLFAWTLAVDVPPRFTEAARPAQPVALELPPPWPAHLAADSAPQGMVSSSVVWPPPAPARDEGWCRDRLADAFGPAGRRERLAARVILPLAERWTSLMLRHDLGQQPRLVRRRYRW